MTPKDTLDRIVELARQEGALTPAKLGRFLGALRDRARLVLEERVEPLAKRADAFEKESHWRAEIQRGLEEEALWRLELQRGLEQSVAALEKELEWRGEVRRGLEVEIESLRAEWRSAAEAHDRLLAHHRLVLAAVVQNLEDVTPQLPWSYKRARARIAELAAALRKELP